VEYLAYGSNMLTSRLAARVPSARDPRVAALPGFVVRYRKISVDGSAKCDLVRAEPSATAYGVVFAIAPRDKLSLDGFEGAGRGYHEERLAVEVDGRELHPLVYLADASHVVDGLVPFDWYRDIVVAGAREHDLPAAYIREQLDVPARADPDEARSLRERSVLGDIGE
jgi:hypothetical protein